MCYTILDRFEADYAICETEDGITRLSRNLLPPDAAEGDLLYLSNGCWTIDKAATAARREAMLKKRRTKNQ